MTSGLLHAPIRDRLVRSLTTTSFGSEITSRSEMDRYDVTMARNLTVHSPPPLRSSTVAWPTHAATAVHAAATAQAVSLAAPVEGGDGGGDAKVRRLRTVTRTVEARLSKATVISSAAGTDCPALRWLLLLDGSGTVTPTKLIVGAAGVRRHSTNKI